MRYIREAQKLNNITFQELDVKSSIHGMLTCTVYGCRFNTCILIRISTRLVCVSGFECITPPRADLVHYQVKKVHTYSTDLREP